MKPARERFYPLSVLLFLLGYITYGLSKGVFVLCAAPLALALTPWPQLKERWLRALTFHYLRWFTQRWLPGLGLYRIVEVSGLDLALNNRPTVCVANHRGFLDALLVLGLLPRTGVVIKARDVRQATYRLLERHFDLVGVDRNSLDSISASLSRCQAVLAANKNLLVFPEGTRARSGRLQRFNRIAFQLAIAGQTPVQPILLHSTHPYMAKLPGSLFPRGRIEYRIRFLDLERPRPDDTADSLSDRVYRRMAQELKNLDAGTCWEVR